MIEEPPFDLLCPGRRPTGIGPVLVPAEETGGPDWNGFAHLLGRIADTRLLPGVNVEVAGIVQPDPKVRAEVVATTGAALGDSTFVAGVRAEPGDDGGLDPAQLAGEVQAAARAGAVPLLLPSPVLDALAVDELLGLVAWAGDWCDRLLVTEGAWEIEMFGALLAVEHCIGVIHRSRRRTFEWDRIRLRDETRPDFQIFSANDRAVDQIMFGADHCLDLAAVVPDLIESRDDAWEAEDIAALERQDALQALASIVSRDPVDGTGHALARVLHARGWLAHDRILGVTTRRPPSDDELIRTALHRLEP